MITKEIEIERLNEEIIQAKKTITQHKPKQPKHHIYGDDL